MASKTNTVIQDATPLYDAARSLLGYFLYTWYSHFLGVALQNIRNWAQAGLLKKDGRPSAVFRKALDLEKLAYICGIYFYVQSAAGRINDRVSNDESPKYLAVLKDHRDTAADISWSFLCSGKSDEFGDYTKAARTTYDRIFAAARQRAATFMRERGSKG